MIPDYLARLKSLAFHIYHATPCSDSTIPRAIAGNFSIHLKFVREEKEERRARNEIKVPKARGAVINRQVPIFARLENRNKEDKQQIKRRGKRFRSLLEDYLTEE